MWIANYKPCVRNTASRLSIRISHKLEKYIIFQHDFVFNFFKVVVLYLSSLVTGSIFMSISLLVLELWQFSFIRAWQEIQKSEIIPSEFCRISIDLVELVIPNLARMYLMKSYWTLQNARFTTFTVSELLREHQQGGGVVKIPIIQIKVEGVDCDSFGTFFVIQRRITYSC